MNRLYDWLLLVLVVLPIAGTEWKPSDQFLRAVCVIESTNGQFTYGDEGQSLGHFQISEGAWLDVNVWRKERGLKVYSYTANVHNAYISRVYASNYLTILHRSLSRRLGRPPTPGELYAAYNMGLASFAECNYKLNRVNRVTQDKARQIHQLLAKAG